jgi:hypothetical protein
MGILRILSQNPLIAGVIATVVGGLILLWVTSSGGGTPGGAQPTPTAQPKAPADAQPKAPAKATAAPTKPAPSPSPKARLDLGFLGFEAAPIVEGAPTARIWATEAATPHG